MLENLTYLVRRHLFHQSDPYVQPGGELIEQARENEQRRRFLRAGCIVTAELTCGERRENAVVISLSGNGLLFVSNHPWSLGSELEVRGEFFGRVLGCRIRIAREDEALTGLQSLYGYGGEFVFIREDDRRHIIESIFRQNRWLKDLLP